MPHTRSFFLTHRRRIPWAALGVSAVLHALFLFFRVEGRLPELPRPAERPIVLLPAEPAHTREPTAPFYSPRRERRSGVGRVPVIPREPDETPRIEVPPPRVVAVTPVDSAVHRAPAGRIGPGLGDGRLWVRPLPLPPKELAQRLQRTNAELADSAVHAIIQAFLDSVAHEPGADQIGMPDWTTKVAGVKFGLDSKNIYIAGLKIPAAVLALLPLPGGNQQNALDHTSDFIYRDLRQAAMRAYTVDDFKQAVRELRARKEREREFQKAQRTPPDSTKQ